MPAQIFPLPEVAHLRISVRDSNIAPCESHFVRGVAQIENSELFFPAAWNGCSPRADVAALKRLAIFAACLIDRQDFALSGLGRVEFQRKDYAKAAELLQQAIAIDPSVRQAHYYLGLAYARLGRKEDSEKELQVASSLEHEEVEKHRSILKLMDSGQNPDELKQEP